MGKSEEITMNRELINNLRLDSGISRLADEKTLVCLSKDGKVIDPIDGLAIFAELIVQECLEVVSESDPSPKMTMQEPYSTIMENIKEHFGWHDERGT